MKITKRALLACNNVRDGAVSEIDELLRKPEGTYSIKYDYPKNEIIVDARVVVKDGIAVFEGAPHVEVNDFCNVMAINEDAAKTDEEYFNWWHKDFEEE